jgi:hypothetical protein
VANPLFSPYLRIGLLGLLVAVVILVLRGPEQDQGASTIVITGTDLLNVEARFRRTWQRDATDDELRRSLEQHVRQEVLYREALARGYDRDDPAVRVAMQQKMEFLAVSQVEQQIPTDQEVEAFFSLRQEQYRRPAVLSFVQVYLKPDTDVDARASEMLERLREEDPALSELYDWGDPTLLDAWFESRTTVEVDRNFGGDFAAQLEAVAVGEWSGPHQSGLGLHLVKVVAREESRIPELAEVAPSVIADLQYEAGQAAREQLYQEIAQNYRVILDAPVRALVESSPE